VYLSTSLKNYIKKKSNSIK